MNPVLEEARLKLLEHQRSGCTDCQNEAERLKLKSYGFETSRGEPIRVKKCATEAALKGAVTKALKSASPPPVGHAVSVEEAVT